MAATATILLNVTLMAAVGTLIVTPDAPLLVASSFVLFFLAKVLETGRGAWWLAVGAAVGCGAAVEIHRAVLRPGDPDLARGRAEAAALAALALALSRRARCARDLLAGHPLERRSPLGLVPQADRGRARIEDFRPAFIAELIPTQIAFATPLVFILGAMGLHALARRKAGALAARVLVNAMFWTIIAYFVWHSLHARVEANWFAPVYPAFAIAAAVAAHLVRWEPRCAARRRFLPALGRADRHRDVRAADRAGQYRLLSGYRRDATVRSVGVGWRELAGEIEAVRVRTGATCVLAPDYGTTGWLAFYLPQGTCVAQQTPAHPLGQHARARSGAACRASCSMSTRCDPTRAAVSEGHCSRAIERVAELPRKRGPLVIETYALDLLEGAEGRCARPFAAAGAPALNRPHLAVRAALHQRGISQVGTVVETALSLSGMTSLHGAAGRERLDGL